MKKLKIFMTLLFAIALIVSLSGCMSTDGQTIIKVDAGDATILGVKLTIDGNRIQDVPVVNTGSVLPSFQIVLPYAAKSLELELSSDVEINGTVEIKIFEAGMVTASGAKNTVLDVKEAWTILDKKNPYTYNYGD